ncbi:TPA: fimbrial protein [Serratia marcescens]
MRYGFTKLTFVSMVIFFSFLKAASGSMYVYPMEVTVGLKGASQLKVISQGDEVQFIKVNLKQVLDPGTKKEKEKQIDSSDLASIIITPQKIALSPTSERVVRLVSVIPPKKETTWRAYFESVNEDNFISQQVASDSSLSKTNIGVNVVWGVLIHVAPEKIAPSLKILDNGGKISNNGTIRIPVKELGTCNNAGQCQWKKISLTVYPDTEASVPNVTFVQDKEYRIKYFNWITGKTEEISLIR